MFRSLELYDRFVLKEFNNFKVKLFRKEICVCSLYEDTVIINVLLNIKGITYTT